MVIQFFTSKLGTMCATTFSFFGTIALTEAFFGQLIIALIAAIPPTGAVAVALVSLKRGQVKQQANQAEMAKALDGKLDALMSAKEDVAKAEGIAKERLEERERVLLAAAVPKEPLKVEVINPPTAPVPTVAANGDE